MVLIEAAMVEGGGRGGGAKTFLARMLLGGGGGRRNGVGQAGGKTLLLKAPGMEALEVALPERKTKLEREGEEGGGGGEHDADVVVSHRSAASSSKTTPSRCCCAQVWLDRCSGRDLGEEAGRWISKYLLGREDGGLRIVYHVSLESSRCVVFPLRYRYIFLKSLVFNFPKAPPREGLQEGVHPFRQGGRSPSVRRSGKRCFFFGRRLKL